MSIVKQGHRHPGKSPYALDLAKSKLFYHFLQKRRKKKKREDDDNQSTCSKTNLVGPEMEKKSSIRLPHLRANEGHMRTLPATQKACLTSTCPFYGIVFKGTIIWNYAYHTFSNVVSNSRKLKFRPIIIKRPPKPTFFWYVLQAGPIAFKRFLSFSAYTVSKLSVSPSPGLCSPGGSSGSTMVTAPLAPLPAAGRAPEGERAADAGWCSLQG